MTSFHNLPIKRKLTLITLAISGTALLLACAAFAFIEQGEFRRSNARDFAILADMFDDNVASGLAFNDPDSIQQTLGTLNANPNILAACVYNTDGEILASYQRSGLVGFSFPPARFTSQISRPDRLDTFKDVVLGGEQIGVVYIGTDLGVLRDRAARYVLIVAVLLLGCSLVALLLVAPLQKLISQPIVELARIAGNVAAGDFSRRATKRSGDEVGRLIDAFNEMLGHIQARNAELQEARAQLEKRVAERTAELNLEKSRFKFIFDSVPIGFSWMLRGQLDTRIANPALGRISGVPNERCRELDLYHAATHPEDRAQQDQLHGALVRGEIEHYEMEKRYVHPDGTTRWALLTVKFYRDEVTGEVQEIRTTVDITERKRAEEELRWKTAFLEALVESPLFGLRVVDPAGKTIFQNQRTVELWKLPPALVTDQDAHLHFLGQIEQPAAFLGRLQNVAAHETTQDEIKLRDSTVIDCYSAPVVGKDGQTYGRIFAYQDITERKQAEARLAETSALLEMLLENSPDLIYFKDQRSRFVRYSRSLCTRFNVQPEALVGKTDRDFFGEIHARAAFDDEQRIIRTGEPIIGMLEKEDYTDGRLTWSLSTKLPWRDASGRIIGTFGISKDVTPLKEAEAKAAESHKQLLEISRQAGMAEVATGVLHNVGNVLNSVNVSTTLISDLVRHSKIDKVGKVAELLAAQQQDLASFFAQDPRGQKVPAFLQALSSHLDRERGDVLKEIEALRKNIEHIKDIVAMQQNYAKVSGVCETIRVVELVEDALRMNSGALVRHDVSLVRDFQITPLVTVEKHKVLQILVNLMRNAKYACDDSGRSDKVMTVRISGAGSHVRIEVIDNGVGIPPENLTRIFSHGFTTRKHGHGFGLHSCALAARELGGSLLAHSEGHGHGATFTLELPLPTGIRDDEPAPSRLSNSSPQLVTRL